MEWPQPRVQPPKDGATAGAARAGSAIGPRVLARIEGSAATAMNPEFGYRFLLDEAHDAGLPVAAPRGASASTTPSGDAFGRAKSGWPVVPGRRSTTTSSSATSRPPRAHRIIHDHHHVLDWRRQAQPQRVQRRLLHPYRWLLNRLADEARFAAVLSYEAGSTSSSTVTARRASLSGALAHPQGPLDHDRDLDRADLPPTKLAGLDQTIDPNRYETLMTPPATPPA